MAYESYIYVYHVTVCFFVVVVLIAVGSPNVVSMLPNMLSLQGMLFASSAWSNGRSTNAYHYNHHR